MEYKLCGALSHLVTVFKCVYSVRYRYSYQILNGKTHDRMVCFFIAAAVFFLFMSAGLLSHASYEFQKVHVFIALLQVMACLLVET